VNVLKVLKRIEGGGIHETAHRTRQRCAQVFRYAVQTARAERDPTVDLKGALAPLLFVRPGELRHEEWTEFELDSDEPLWRIPAEKMKMRQQHFVPLAKQALVPLRELQSVTGLGQYVFPSLRSSSRPMSENTVNAALRRMGYSTDEMTGHGFRSLASTCLNEQDYHPDVTELQFAHA
jgi:integrase